jgi:hypothetical protein
MIALTNVSEGLEVEHQRTYWQREKAITKRKHQNMEVARTLRIAQLEPSLELDPWCQNKHLPPSRLLLTCIAAE